MRWIIWLLALGLFVSGTTQPSHPTITKVSPPHWWTPTNWRDLLLLCEGQNLKGAKVISLSPDLTVTKVQEANERYLLVWLRLAPNATPRPHRLIFRTLEGETTVAFPLRLRPPQRVLGKGLTKNEIIYLLMPDRFCDGDPTNNDPQGLKTYDRTNPRAYHGGDLKGIRQRLPYLRDLGITALWHTPVYDNDDASPDEYHGYHPVDHFAVDEHFGTMDDYRDLVFDAHRLGIKIVQDHVLNHCGPKHPWVIHPPTPNWLHSKMPADYRLALLLSPETLAEEKSRIIRGWLFGILPDLNQDEPAVSHFLIQHSLWWLMETGADAVRVDTMPYMPRPFLQRWRNALRCELPKVTVIGEVLPVPPDARVQAFFQGGRIGYDGVDTGFESVFDFALAIAIRQVFGQDEPMGRLKEVLDADALYLSPNDLITLLGNHDFPRFFTIAKPYHRWQRLKLAAAFLLTTRGSIQWYYGDEIGMEGGDDPDNRRDFPGGFPNDLRNAFTPGGRNSDENNLWNWVRQLFWLRRRLPWLATAPTHWWLVEPNTLIYERRHKTQRLFVLLHRSSQPLEWALPFASGRLIAGEGKLWRTSKGWRVRLPPWSVALILTP